MQKQENLIIKFKDIKIFSWLASYITKQETLCL